MFTGVATVILAIMAVGCFDISLKESRAARPGASMFFFAFGVAAIYGILVVTGLLEPFIADVWNTRGGGLTGGL